MPNRCGCGALGQQAIIAIEVIKKVAEGNIRITPDILVAGEKGGLIDILLAQLVKKGAAPPAVTAAVADPAGAQAVLNPEE